MSSSSQNYKVYVSAIYFRIPGKVKSVSTESFHFNIKVEVMTRYLSDVTVNMRNKHDPLGLIFNRPSSSQSRTKPTMDIKDRIPPKSFSFECQNLTRDIISGIISDANIVPFSLDRLQWTGNQKDWIPLKNQEDMMQCLLNLTNNCKGSSASSVTDLQKEFSLHIKINKETILPHDEFERMDKQRRAQELAAKVSAMISFVNQQRERFRRPFQRSTWENDIHQAVRERGASLGVDSYESLIDLVTSDLGEARHKPIPALKSSVDALPEVKFDDDHEHSTTKCVICLENMVGSLMPIKRMPCSHLFHQTCLGLWLRISHVCLLCRTKMPT